MFSAIAGYHKSLRFPKSLALTSCYADFAVEMASAAGATGWLRGIVKAVPSGDSLVIMGNTKAEIPPEKTITLSSLMAPKLVSFDYIFI